MKNNMLLKGFSFGMLLQIAIGPVCIFIFQSAVSMGFIPAFKGVLGVALTDGSEIVLAILGTAAILDKKPNLKKFFGVFSGFIVLMFGGNAVVSAFTPTVLTVALSENMFVAAIVLAASNPLTILFWAGVFTARISAGDMRKGDMWIFGAGCVLSTLTFLTAVAFAGNLTAVSIPAVFVKVLNIISGVAISVFAVKNIVKAFKSE